MFAKYIKILRKILLSFADRPWASRQGERVSGCPTTRACGRGRGAKQGREGVAPLCRQRLARSAHECSRLTIPHTVCFAAHPRSRGDRVGAGRAAGGSGRDGNSVNVTWPKRPCGWLCRCLWGGGHAEALQRWGHLPPQCGGSRTPDESPGQHVTQVPSDKSLRMPPQKSLKNEKAQKHGGNKPPSVPTATAARPPRWRVRGRGGECQRDSLNPPCTGRTPRP